MNSITLPTIDKIQSSAIKFIRTINKSEAPYHSSYHMIEVANIARLILQLNYACNEDKLVIVLAALFHDLNHSGGKYPDHMNIDSALSALDFFRSCQSNLLGIPEHVFDRAAEAIRCTEFPFIHEPQDLVQKALRDADILYPAYIGDPRIVMEHLRSEIGVTRGQEITYSEMLEGQQAFMNQAKLYTDVGLFMWDSVASQYMNAMSVYAQSYSKY